MKIALAVVLLLAAGIGSGCALVEEPYPNGKTWIKGNGAIYSVHYVLDHNEDLLYAFVADPSLVLYSTGDAEEPPQKDTVHWLRGARDGLWVFGEKVQFPTGSKVFAIRKDGTVHPIPCTAEQMRAIAPGGGLDDDAFVREALLPALGQGPVSG